MKYKVRLIGIIIFILTASLCCQNQAFAWFERIWGPAWKSTEIRESPGSTWIAEREECTSTSLHECLDTNLTIRKPGEPVDSRNAILYISSDQSVMFKWLDDSHLLVAGQKQSDLSHAPDHGKAPDQFRGVHIVYALYPDDPDVPRTSSVQAVRPKEATTSFQFQSPESELSFEPRRCELHIAVKGEERLSVTLIAGKHISVTEPEPLPIGPVTQEELEARNKAFDERAKKSKLISFGALAVSATLGPARAGGQITSASFGSMVLGPNIVLAGSASSPAWDISKWGLDGADVARMLQSVVTGSAELKLGLWLDDLEVIYPVDGLGRSDAVQSFRQCMAEKGLFEDAP